MKIKKSITLSRVAKDCCKEFSKSNFWTGVEELLFKLIFSFAKKHFYNKLKKKKKKLPKNFPLFVL